MPPSDQPQRRALRYDDFALRLDPLGDGRAVAQILHATGGGGSTEVRLPDASEIDEVLALLDRSLEEEGEPPAHVQSKIEVLGRKLFDSLFSGRVRDSFFRSRGHGDDEAGRGVRLRLIFDPLSAPGTPGTPGFGGDDLGREILRWAAIPWELLHGGRGIDWLALERTTPLVRYLETERPTILPPLEPPVRVLFARSQGGARGGLGLEAEIEAVRRATETGEVELAPPVWARRAGELRDLLDRGAHHVLHLACHGSLDPATGRGLLHFETPDGRNAPVTGEELGRQLAGLPHLRLVVLNACDSDRRNRQTGTDFSASVAAALVFHGVPAVVAMQRPVSDGAARALSSRLYTLLARGRTVEEALSESRRAILDAPGAGPWEWATPVLTSRLAPGTILPTATAGAAATRRLRAKVHDASFLIEQRTAGFVGRRFVFDAFERFLDEARSGYFLVTGEPGIGKSAIVAELARSRGWTRHFNVLPLGVTQPKTFLENVAAQLILHHGLDEEDLPPEAGRDGGYLSNLLQRIVRQGDRVVVLVDALDESDSRGLAPGVNPLYLPPVLPHGVHFLLTSQPLQDRLRIEGPLEPLTLDPDSADNRADVEELIGDHLGRPGLVAWVRAQEMTATEFVSWMAERSEGNFMYLSHVLPALDRGEYRDTSFERLPRGLDDYYASHWRRMRDADPGTWEHRLRVLGALVAREAPVRADQLLPYTGLDDRRLVGQALRQFRQFLRIEELPADRPDDRPVKLYSIYHGAFRDFLRRREEIGELDLGAASRRIAEYWLETHLGSL